MTRRELGAILVPMAVPGWIPQIVKRNDTVVAQLIETQITDPANRFCGACPDQFGMYPTHLAGQILEAGTASFLSPDSTFYHQRELAARLKLAARWLERNQNAQGNIDFIYVNFNSPPDTAFLVHGVATAARIATVGGERELAGCMERFLRRAGSALATGGIHTPNHRWVVCAALAQLNELFPDPRFVRRIDQWLAEGIDIDGDGQYTERSTAIYNATVDRALIVMSAKLNRPELLEPVRKNLGAMLYLLHPHYEVVTEISRRQDQNHNGDMGAYWFPLRYLAVRDGSGMFAKLADHFSPTQAKLSTLVEYPELTASGPVHAALPENYQRTFPEIGVARIRRGSVSATLILTGSSRFFTLRSGDAVLNAVRLACAFFGKGQFVPRQWESLDGGWRLAQSITGDYMQPAVPPRLVAAGEWAQAKPARRRSEICRLEQRATVREQKGGFEIRMQVDGTPGVPVCIEISLGESGTLEGCTPVPGAPGCWLLTGETGVYRQGNSSLRFGPGLSLHRYIHQRGAEAKLPGESVYLTGYTPFDHTLKLQCG
jgi:hypothetical protein